MAYNLMDLRRRIIASQPNDITREGSIVTFGTNIARPMQVTCALSPVQSGSGDPYPPGGSAQKWDEEWESGSLDANGQNTASASRIRSKNYIPVSAETSYYFKSNGKTIGLRWYDSNKDCITSANTSLSDKAWSSPAGAEYLRFTVVDETTYNNNISINYPSTDHDYHAYSNICPIYGWTGCNVVRTGNLINESTNVVGKYINSSGNVASASYYQYTALIPVTEGETYTVSIKETASVSSSTARAVSGYNSSGTFVNRIASQNVTANTKTSVKFDVTIPSGITHIRLNYGTEDIGCTFSKDYTTIPITWQTEAGTVYGGTMTLNRDGSVTVVATHGYVNGGLTWKKASNNNFYSDGIKTLIEPPASENAVADLLCSQYVKDTLNNVYAKTTNNTIGVYGATHSYAGRIMIYDSEKASMTASQFEDAMDGVQLVYPLATPLTYTISASALNSLLGVNNVWADAGDVSVKAWGF